MGSCSETAAGDGRQCCNSLVPVKEENCSNKSRVLNKIL